jgi:hypothetical protein
MTDYPEPLVFVSWPKDFDGPGFDARSSYVEHCWCSVIGPTAVMVLRTVACLLEHSPGPVAVPSGELASLLGVGHGAGRNAVVPHTLARLERFGLAIGLPTGEVAVRTVLPVLSERQVQRAGRMVQAAHQQYLSSGSVEVRS